MNASKIVEMYKGNNSLASIAKVVGVSEDRVKQILKDGGFYIPQRRIPPKRDRQFYDYFDGAELAELLPILKACHFAGYRAVR